MVWWDGAGSLDKTGVHCVVWQNTTGVAYRNKLHDPIWLQQGESYEKDRMYHSSVQVGSGEEGTEACGVRDMKVGRSFRYDRGPIGFYRDDLYPIASDPRLKIEISVRDKDVDKVVEAVKLAAAGNVV